MNNLTDDEALFWESGIPAVATWGAGDEEGGVALVCLQDPAPSKRFCKLSIQDSEATSHFIPLRDGTA